MKKIGLTVIAALCAGAFLYQLMGLASAEAQSGERSGGTTQRRSTRAARQDSRPFEAKFWNWLQAARYQNWAPAPGQNGGFYEGKAPHGAQLKMYLNRTAVADFDNLPHGSIIVKENYTPEKELAAVTVMYRSEGYDPEHNDWYWVKYLPEGTVDRTPAEKGNKPIAGRFPSCINCHSGADGNDFAFAND